MSSLPLSLKSKNPRVKRILRAREPKIVENVKKCLLLKGTKTSALVSDALKELHHLKKPESRILSKRNDIHPFDNHSSIEFLCQHNDCSLFVFASHTKKRPHNLVMGRCFDFQLLDMFEFGIDPKNFRQMAAFTGRSHIPFPSKPMLVFNGDMFDLNPEFSLMKNFFIDFFRGEELEKISVEGLARVLSFTATENKTIHIRQYAAQMKKSGTKLPRIELEEAGPRMDFAFRRYKGAPDELRKKAMQVPKADKVHGQKKIKNIQKDEFGKRGLIHMKPNNLNKINIFKGMRGLEARGKRKKEATIPTTPTTTSTSSSSLALLSSSSASSSSSSSSKSKKNFSASFADADDERPSQAKKLRL
eukprot:TRINITY_DN5922_c0_g1_i1.p1 TRINITY_DN5922_c0_g1~~TRINITY_DN5922_c0_g1_i1.p1  ORF type:complete len:360 (-),score=87.23 TRINITY_DN5922_c0_g1_i1:369-1448(-)